MQDERVSTICKHVNYLFFSSIKSIKYYKYFEVCTVVFDMTNLLLKLASRDYSTLMLFKVQI